MREKEILTLLPERQELSQEDRHSDKLQQPGPTLHAHFRTGVVSAGSFESANPPSTVFTIKRMKTAKAKTIEKMMTNHAQPLSESSSDFLNSSA